MPWHMWSMIKESLWIDALLRPVLFCVTHDANSGATIACLCSSPCRNLNPVASAPGSVLLDPQCNNSGANAATGGMNSFFGMIDFEKLLVVKLSGG